MRCAVVHVATFFSCFLFFFPPGSRTWYEHRDFVTYVLPATSKPCVFVRACIDMNEDLTKRPFNQSSGAFLHPVPSSSICTRPINFLERRNVVSCLHFFLLLLPSHICSSGRQTFFCIVSSTFLLLK